jgi:hypothetical protein
MKLFNKANIVLVPKSEAGSTNNISLINSLIKIITKIPANRLAPYMNEFHILRMHSSRKSLYTTISFMYKE